jgi:hypothetical protein
MSTTVCINILRIRFFGPMTQSNAVRERWSIVRRAVINPSSRRYIDSMASANSWAISIFPSIDNRQVFY